MTETKYRAWDSFASKMWYDVYFDGGHIFTIGGDGENASTMPRWDDNALMKFTGYQDINSLEIYEDDIVESDICNFIVRFGEYANNNSNESTHLGFYLEQIGNKFLGLRCDFLFWLKERNLKKIGNIHENPELMVVA